MVWPVRVREYHQNLCFSEKSNLLKFYISIKLGSLQSIVVQNILFQALLRISGGINFFLRA